MSPKVLLACLALLLSGCVQPITFTEASLPQLPAGQARIYFLRDTVPGDAIVATEVTLGGKPVGFIQAGGIVYRDLAPGSYEVGASAPHFGPDAAKTVTLSAGQVAYAGIQTPMPDDDFTMGNTNYYGPFLAFMEAAQARPIMAHLRFTGALGG